MRTGKHCLDTERLRLVLNRFSKGVVALRYPHERQISRFVALEADGPVPASVRGCSSIGMRERAEDMRFVWCGCAKLSPNCARSAC